MKHRLLRPFRWYFGKTALPFWLVLIVDCLIVVLAGLMADLLHNQGGRELSSFVTLVVSLSCYLVAYLVGFIIMRTYRSVIRYSSFVDLFRVSLANLIGASLVFVVRHITSIDQFL
ncbi:MAG: polysaccharide biosynthesis protein, partial [Bacteroidaceae bacterium]|nr:polysaccharide biosynthesis protein [Bacteroidaceae bacterium]